MKDFKLKPSECFLLNNLLTGCDKDKVEEHFMKKSYTSCRKEYKEGSANYLAEVAKDEAIAALPSYDVKEVCILKISKHEYSLNAISWHVQSITYEKSTYNYDMGEYEEYSVTEHFLVENSHRGNGLICNMDDLYNNSKFRDLLEGELYDNLLNHTVKVLGDVHPSFGRLAYIVVEAQKELKKFECYTRYKQHGTCLVIDDTDVYTAIEIDAVLADYKNGVRFYDEEDRKVSFCDYGVSSFSDYLRYHRQYSKS